LIQALRAQIVVVEATGVLSSHFCAGQERAMIHYEERLPNLATKDFALPRAGAHTSSASVEIPDAGGSMATFAETSVRNHTARSRRRAGNVGGPHGHGRIGRQLPGGNLSWPPARVLGTEVRCRSLCRRSHQPSGQ